MTALAVGPPAGGAPRVETVLTHLPVPWALAFAPDGRLFFTERPGRLRVVSDGKLAPEPVARLPVSAVGEGGLMGLALDPDFGGYEGEPGVALQHVGVLVGRTPHCCRIWPEILAWIDAHAG